MNVVLADIEERPLRETARFMASAGSNAIAVVTDVSDVASVETLRERALEVFGAVHLVCNNAGVAAGGLLWTITEPDWRWLIGVNLWGVINGIRAFMPLLLAQDEGHLVNTASAAGLVTPPLMGPYCATKHAVVAISEILYRDLRLANSHVGVSVLCPGHVRTAIGESERNRPPWAPARADVETDPAAQRVRSIVRQQIEGGIEPDEVAAHVLDAVRSNRFYILTHPEWNAAIETRVRDILENRAPAPFEPTRV
jgi:NAD(P)-dependent dehydrogenase (short-subunit alcohol dehydrogenase family)